MSYQKRLNAKNRREGGSFLALPHVLLNHQNFINISPYAKALLLDIASQYKGYNNGDLCACWTVMVDRGWKSRDTLGRKLEELEESGFIMKTRQGGRNKPNLYAITWQAIDYCSGKLDVKETNQAPGCWKK